MRRGRATKGSLATDIATAGHHQKVDTDWIRRASPEIFRQREKLRKKEEAAIREKHEAKKLQYAMLAKRFKIPSVCDKALTPRV